MPPILTEIKDPFARDPQELLEFYRSVVMALLLRAGGTIILTQAEWPEENKRYSIIDEVSVDPATDQEAIKITIQQEV